MKISCPKCATQYDIEENLIPVQGRKFRCAKCDNIWLVQKPEDSSAELSLQDSLETTSESLEDIDDKIEDISPALEEEQELDAEKDTSEELVIEKKDEEQSELDTEVTSEQNLEAEQEVTSSTSKSDIELSEEQSNTSSEVEPELNSSKLDDEEDKEDEDDKDKSISSSNINEDIQDIPDQLKSISSVSYNSEVDISFSPNKTKVLSFIFLGFAILMSLYIGRFYLVSKIPPLQSCFEAIGISFDVIGEGLAFQDIKKEKKIINDLNYLVISGVIINESDSSKEVPNLILYLYSKDSKLIQKQEQSLSVSSLTPGETVDFVINLEAPSSAATEAKLSFIKAIERNK